MGHIPALICATLITVDGDTVKCDGNNLRPMGPGEPFLSGFDTPEIRRPRCNFEAKLAGQAMARFAELIETPDMFIEFSGWSTDDGRPLVWLRLPSGETVGEILLKEGLARVWLPNTPALWCHNEPPQKRNAGH